MELWRVCSTIRRTCLLQMRRRSSSIPFLSHPGSRAFRPGYAETHRQSSAGAPHVTTDHDIAVLLVDSLHLSKLKAISDSHERVAQAAAGFISRPSLGNLRAGMSTMIGGVLQEQEKIGSPKIVHNEESSIGNRPEATAQTESTSALDQLPVEVNTLEDHSPGAALDARIEDPVGAKSHSAGADSGERNLKQKKYRGGLSQIADDITGYRLHHTQIITTVIAAGLPLNTHTLNQLVGKLMTFKSWRGAVLVHKAFAEQGVPSDLTTATCMTTIASLTGRPRNARFILKALRQQGELPLSYAVTAFHAFKRLKDVQMVLYLSSLLRARGKGFDAADYTKFIYQCYLAKDWAMAKALVDDALAAGHHLPELAYVNAILTCQAVHAMGALELLKKAEKELGGPTLALFSAAMKSCQVVGDWANARALLTRMQAVGIAPDSVTWSAAVGACSRGGQPALAEKLMDSLLATGMDPSSSTWSNLIAAYGRVPEADAETSCAKAEDAFARMVASGHQPTDYTWGSLIGVYCHFKQTHKVFETIEKMREQGGNGTFITWEMAISSAAESGMWEKANALLQEMADAGFPPSGKAYASIIRSYGEKGMWERSRDAYANMLAAGVTPDHHTYGSLVMSYIASNKVNAAFELVKSMPEQRVLPNRKLCIALIECCIENGHWEQAVEALAWLRSRAFIAEYVKNNFVPLYKKSNITNPAVESLMRAIRLSPEVASQQTKSEEL